MKGLEKQLFSRFPPAELVKPDGSRKKGRGIVVRQRAPTGALGLDRHPLGELSQPLYVFTGALAEADRGDQLCQGGTSYRVISAQPVGLAGKPLWMRVVLEKEEREYEGI